MARRRLRPGEGRRAEACAAVEPSSGDLCSLFMLKLAAILLVLMIVFGVLGFVVDVAGALARIAFFVCLVGLGLSLAGKALRRD